MSPDSNTAYLALLVLFASTLGISVGLRYGTQAGRSRHWADAHAIASAGGMALAVSALAPSPFTTWLAQATCLLAQMMVFRGTASTGIPTIRIDKRPMYMLSVAVLMWLALIAASCDPVCAQQLISMIGHAATAAVVWQTLRLLTNERRAHRGLGHALVTVACCAQLAAQGLLTAWAFSKGLGNPTTWAVEEGALAQAPLLLMLIAAVSGLIGFTLLGTERLMAEQRALARLDPLTGLLHRGALERAAVARAADAARHGDPLCCLAIDVDRFKQVNDAAGHLAGDEVLMRIAQTLRDSCRTTDIVARFGGEEFCVLCPATGIDDAMQLAERIRERIEFVGLPREVGGHASVSIGVAQSRPMADARESWEDLFARADRALYRAKHEGRNRVVRATVTAQAEGLPAEWHAACGVSVGG